MWKNSKTFFIPQSQGAVLLLVLLLFSFSVARAQNPLEGLLKGQATPEQQEALQGPTKSDIEGKIEELRQRISRAEQQAGILGKNPDYMNALAELQLVYGRQLAALDQAESLVTQSKALDQRLLQFVESLDKPYQQDPFLKALKFQSEIENLKRLSEEQSSILKTSKSLAQEQSNVVQQLERALRLKQDKGSSVDGVELEVEQEQLNLARAKQYLQNLEYENERQASELIASTLKIFEQSFEQIEGRKQFSQFALDTLVADLETRVKELEKLSSKASTSLRQAEANRLKQSGDRLTLLQDPVQIYTKVVESYAAAIAAAKQRSLYWSALFELQQADSKSQQDRYRTLVAERDNYLHEQEKTSLFLTEVLRSLSRINQKSGLETSPQVENSRKALLALSSALEALLREVSVTQDSLELVLKTLDAPNIISGSPRKLVEYTGTLFSDLWNYEILVIDQSPLTPGKIFFAALLLIGGYLASRWITKRLSERWLSRLRLESGVQAAVQSISFYLLLTFFVLLALKIVHIPLTIFTLVGGALAIGIGFGSQNVMNNFISGLIMLVERPLRVADIVEFQGVRGTIRRIGARSTVLVTPENLEVIVPNSSLLENNVINWTLANNLVRRTVKVGVAYGSPTRQVSELLLKAAESHGKILEQPAPEVFFSDFGDSALNFELRIWVQINAYTDAIRVESDLRHMIDQSFKAAGIVIAFPQRDLHLDTPGLPLKVQILSGPAHSGLEEGAPGESTIRMKTAG